MERWRIPGRRDEYEEALMAGAPVAVSSATLMQPYSAPACLSTTSATAARTSIKTGCSTSATSCPNGLSRKTIKLSPRRRSVPACGPWASSSACCC